MVTIKRPRARTVAPRYLRAMINPINDVQGSHCTNERRPQVQRRL